MNNKAVHITFGDKSISTICTAGVPSAFFLVWTPYGTFRSTAVWSRTALRGLAYLSSGYICLQNRNLPSCSKADAAKLRVFENFHLFISPPWAVYEKAAITSRLRAYQVDLGRWLLMVGALNSTVSRYSLHVADFGGVVVQAPMTNSMWSCPASGTGTAPPSWGKSAPAMRVVLRLAQTVSTDQLHDLVQILPGRWQTPGTGGRILDVLQHQIPITCISSTDIRIPSFRSGGLAAAVSRKGKWNRYLIPQYLIFWSFDFIFNSAVFRIWAIQIRGFP